ncbi:protein kinase, partial [Cellulomonas bogoriensis 69B4 = DSM 16987]
MKPAPGVALGGRYRLVSRIAVGGMGEVWVAHDESLARDVAVKVLREEFAGDAGFLERFRTEARNSAGLSHPNIAALYDYGEQDGSGFLVMELVLGEPMSDLLDRQPVLPTMRLLPILAQTARALHAAHAGGVVHRDVKPGNIILARSGRVKITDFGISTATNQVPMTASGMVMGTAQYLSPEQAVGKAATPASDIYSLGIVAYEALVGHRPFTGPTAVDIAVAHVNQPVPPMPDGIDRALAGVVMQMLDKNPENRPRSAASVARTLDGMLERTPPGGVPIAGGRHSRPVDVLHTSEIEAQLGVVTVTGRPARAGEPVRPAGTPGASDA